MYLDIVIPTSNNLKTKNFSLYYTLRSILSQSLQPQKIIVVENLAFEETQFYLKNEFGDLVYVIDGTANPKNISYARNLGATAGSCELIIFMDDDVLIGKSDFFVKIKARMINLDFFCGAYRYWTKTDWPEYLSKTYSIPHIQHILKHKTYLPKSINRITGQPSFHEYSHIGHFGAIKRKVFESVNGFDENFKGWLYQDTDLMMRLCAAGFNYDLMYLDDVFVYHLSHEADKTFFLETNKLLYEKKENMLGISFRLNHFFGIFDDDSYAIFE